MPELWSVHATEDACGIAMRASRSGRVAADEVFVAGRIPPDIRTAIGRVDPDALIRAADDGWEEIRLEREEAERVWPRLSELELPASGYLQGAFAGLGVRVFAGADAVSLFVRPTVAAHVRRRIEVERG